MRAFLAALCFALLIPGCVLRPAAPPAPVALDLQDQNRPVQLVPGQNLTVTLPSHYTRGYQWMWMNPVNPVISQVEKPHFRAGAGGTAEGGTEVWTFRAERPGEVVLRLDLRRPWTTQSPPQQSLSFPVQVK